MTKTINLRDLPDDVVRRAKASAALHGMTLRDFVLRAIGRAIEEEIPFYAAPMAAMTKPETKRRTRKG